MLLNDMMEMARRAGEISLAEAGSMTERQVEYKGERDLVTPVDRKVEDFLRSEIRRMFPDHAIIGEERGSSTGGSDSCWIIDPIDGTNSYVHGLPGYSVSIAVQRSGETVAGVVYGPVLNLLFAAERGRGATLNGRKIKVSPRAELRRSVLTTGFACFRDGQEDEGLAIFNRIAPRARDIRRHGSAALDLAWVAAGNMDGYWEKGLKLYDFAAGVLLVTEAGGRVIDYSGGVNFLENGLVATNGLIERELLHYLVSD